jgi:hypothetical protein
MTLEHIPGSNAMKIAIADAAPDGQFAAAPYSAVDWVECVVPESVHLSATVGGGDVDVQGKIEGDIALYSVRPTAQSLCGNAPLPAPPPRAPSAPAVRAVDLATTAKRR